MRLYISHKSALDYWRRVRKLPEGSAERRCKAALTDTPLEIDPMVFSRFDLPVHVMIGRPGCRRASKFLRQHVFSGETPVGCFMNAGGGLMVSSPEFCFLQLAGELSLIGLIELGYEMCGGYSLPLSDDSDVPERGFHNRSPLTSAAKLEAFLDGMPGVKGHQKAARALHYLRDGSASPMETKLAMFLTLPRMLGGYGFGLPELNERILLSKTARKEFGKAFYVCDMFWPDEKVAVEYDSDQHHTGSDRIANDSKRRNALASSGISVVSVTKYQLYSSLELGRVAITIAGHMNKRLYSGRNFSAAHRELRKQLLADL